MPAKQHVLHGRDHEHNGMDPVRIAWEDVGSGASGGLLAIMDEGSPLPTRSALNFVGAGVTASDDSANDRTNVSIPGASGGGGSVNPVFIAQAVVLTKVTDTNLPSYTWYCPNWAFSGSGNAIYKNTLGATFANLQGTNDRIVVPGGVGTWYRVQAFWTTLLDNADTTPLNEHYLHLATGNALPVKPGTSHMPNWASEQKATDWGTTTATLYKTVHVQAAGTVRLPDSAGISANLRSINANMDNIINSAQMICAGIVLEQLPYSVGPP